MIFESLVQSVDDVWVGIEGGENPTVVVRASGFVPDTGWSPVGALRPRPRDPKTPLGVIEFDFIGSPLQLPDTQMRSAVLTKVVAGVLFPFEESMSEVRIYAKDGSMSARIGGDQSVPLEEVLTAQAIQRLLGGDDPFPWGRDGLGGENPFPWGHLESNDLVVD